MKVLKKLINSLPDIHSKEVYMGVFDSVVLSRQWGMASSLKPISCGAHQKENFACGLLKGMSIRKMAQYALSDDELAASLGLAAINSAIDIYKEELTEINALEVLSNKSEGKNVAVIGHFPFVSKLKSIAKSLSIIEKRPQEGDLTEEAMEDILPKADVVAMTATSLINHTFEHIMKLVNPRAFVVMLGPSTPLSPILFEEGVDVLSGTIVEDSEVMLRYLLQGASYKQLKGVARVTLIKK